VAARNLALGLHVLHARTEQDLETAFSTMVRLGAAALEHFPERLNRGFP